MPKSNHSPQIGDEAVRKRTGKVWAEWFAILDQAGAKKLDHKGIVALLDEYDIGGWWQQMVTVAYEQERGLRDKHQKPESYEISGSKTVAVPVGELFAAWEDPRLRAKWLKEKIEIRKATKNKSMRITWPDGNTGVSVNFYAQGSDKSQLAVQHGKLADAREAQGKKKFWADALERLRALLEK